MRTSSYVLRPRLYRGLVAPPNVIEDLSRFRNDGVFVNAPTWVGLPGGIWVNNYVAASSQYINCGTADSLINISPCISVLAWVKADPPAATQSVASKFDDNLQQRSWDLGASAGGGLLSGFISDDGTVGGHCKSYYSSIVVYDGSWHQVGMVFDAGTFELVVDGAFDPTPTKTIDDAITTIYYSNTATCLGTALHIGAPMWEYDGQSLITQIANYAMTAAQVWDKFNSQRGWFGV